MAISTIPAAGISSVSATTISSGTLPFAQLPTGSVLQVVQGTATTEASTSGTTFIDTGLTASITPKFSTSKILVIVDQSSCGKTGGDERLKMILTRNGAQIVNLLELGAYTASSANNDIGSVTISYLDSPATTSSTAYKTQFATVNGVGGVRVQWNPSTSTITLMEIAA